MLYEVITHADALEDAVPRGVDEVDGHAELFAEGFGKVNVITDP